MNVSATSAALTLRPLLEQLLSGRSLTESEAAAAMRALADVELPAALGGALLAALRTKGETADELRGFACAMRALARRPEIPRDLAAIDIVGTGGDASGSVNLSTGTALLVAACGVPVVKHGNRSISSRSGSADVLEKIGLRLPLDERAAGECLRATQFTFLFAPHFHPAMKNIAPIRNALGVRTVFNILGPLTNPAQPPFHLIGAYDTHIAELMAQTLAGMPLRRAFVVHGAAGWDEPTPIGPFTIFDVQGARVSRSVRDPRDYGLPRCDPAALAGGDAGQNAAAMLAVLRGAERGAHRDALLLGASLALEITAQVSDPRAGVARAADAIDSGAAAALLDRIAAWSTSPATRNPAMSNKS